MIKLHNKSDMEEKHNQNKLSINFLRILHSVAVLKTSQVLLLGVPGRNFKVKIQTPEVARWHTAIRDKHQAVNSVA